MLEFLRAMGIPVNILLYSPVSLLIGGAIIYYGAKKKKTAAIILGSILAVYGIIYTIIWCVYGFPWNR